MEAYITLVSTDAYAPGALVLARQLHHLGSTCPRACLVTRNVSAHVRALLLDPACGYTRLVDVDELCTTRPENLRLLGRPDLGSTLTKIQLWRLTEYSKLVFLDADTLPVRNIDDLFQKPAFSAAPDTGWPDCFNSGVFVAEPDIAVYHGLVRMATDKGSFDGGDQGLLNSFFCKWPETPHHRLAFTYNTTPSAAYSYLPAYREYRQKIAVVHFIGKDKPWHAQRYADGSIFRPDGPSTELIQLWWDVWDKHFGKHVLPAELIARNVDIQTTAPPRSYHDAHQPWQSSITWDMVRLPGSPIHSSNTTTERTSDNDVPTPAARESVQNTHGVSEQDMRPTNDAAELIHGSIGLQLAEPPHYTFLQSSTFTEATMLEFELDQRVQAKKKR